MELVSRFGDSIPLWEAVAEEQAWPQGKLFEAKKGGPRRYCRLTCLPVFGTIKGQLAEFQSDTEPGFVFDEREDTNESSIPQGIDQRLHLYL
jgi:hypothetical protein